MSELSEVRRAWVVIVILNGKVFTFSYDDETQAERTADQFKSDHICTIPVAYRSVV